MLDSYDKLGRRNWPKLKRLLKDRQYAHLKERFSKAEEQECETRKEIKEAIMRQVEVKLNKELKRLEHSGGGIAFTFELYALNNDRSFKDETDKRNSEEYIAWRTFVFERDSYKCVECGKGNKIQAHHIKEWADHPQDRFDIENGITLCVDCHVKKHPKKEHLIRKSRYHK